MFAKKLVLLSAAVFPLLSCGDSGAPEQNNPPQDVSISVSVDLSAASSVGTIVVQVEAVDIASPLVFNLTVANGVASGTIIIPVGLARTITVRGFDASGNETHSGSITLDIQIGTNPSVTITLAPHLGELPIEVIIGTITIEVRPEFSALAVGGTVLLSSVVTNEIGDTLDVTVRWATLDPGVAVVDPTGLVTATGIGEVAIVATYAGVGGSAQIQVAEAAFREEFDSDVFGTGWTRTDASVAVDPTASLLRVGTNGTVDDGAELGFTANFPLTVEARMRVVSGGNNYRLPYLVIGWAPSHEVDDGAIVMAYASVAGWALGPPPAHETGEHANAPGAEGVWVTITAEIRRDGGKLYSQLDGQTERTLVATAAWSIPEQMTWLLLQQPWDAVSEYDYVAIRPGLIDPSGVGFALDFNGDQVVVPDHDDLDLTAAWTIEAWLKPRDVGSGLQHVVSKWGGCSNGAYSMELNAGKLRSGIASCAFGTQIVESSGTLVVDQWQHVAITLSNDSLSLYINGVRDTVFTGSIAPIATTTPVTFGRQSAGSLAFDGLLDEVRIWSVARTGGELQAGMSGPLSGTTVGLVGYWRFDEGSGDVAADETAGGHAGQLGTAVGVDANDPSWASDVPGGF